MEDVAANHTAKFSSASQSQVYIYSCFGLLDLMKPFMTLVVNEDCGFEKRDFIEV